MNFRCVTCRQQWLLLALAVTAAGCTDNAFFPVSGKVTVDGQSLASGLVRFHAADTGRSGYAQVVVGHYVAKSGSQIGLQPGTYRVTVTAHSLDGDSNRLSTRGQAMPSLITPLRYSQPETSDLLLKVPAKNNEFDISLDSR
jgi:hypothetical protein